MSKLLPAYDEWLNSPNQFYCTCVVDCTDGARQEIRDCIFRYNFSNREVVITKRGYLVSDFFFVKRLVSYELQK